MTPSDTSTVRPDLSIVIPAYNEQGSIVDTVENLYRVLRTEIPSHEILVVNDNSKDDTEKLLQELATRIPTLIFYTNRGPNGFGYAVRYGLARFTGECVAIMMADLSDDPNDLIRFYRAKQEKQVDCVFGSRFMKGGRVYDYPTHKLILNRIANNIIRLVIGTKYNDATNAFKLYSRETIDGLQPLLAPHFNLTIELSLKAIVRGYSYTIVPNSWINRKTGVSKLKIREMGSRYFFILMYCFIEKFFASKDFRKETRTRLQITESR